MPRTFPRFRAGPPAPGDTALFAFVPPVQAIVDPLCARLRALFRVAPGIASATCPRVSRARGVVVAAGVEGPPLLRDSRGTSRSPTACALLRPLVPETPAAFGETGARPA